MGKVFVFDAAKCNGCRNCQIACKDEHVDNEWAPWAKPQPGAKRSSTKRPGARAQAAARMPVVSPRAASCAPALLSRRA